MTHVLQLVGAWTLTSFIFAALWWAWRADARANRDEAKRLPRIDTRPMLPPPPIRFTRDPSPRPRTRAS